MCKENLVGSSLWVMVLAGGKGERFWPLSTTGRPKPLLDLGMGRSLLDDTLRRAGKVAAPSRTRVVAAEQLAPSLRKEIRKHRGVGILLEPAARNTGPAALLATRWVWERDPEATVLLLPSDHGVRGLLPFRGAVQKARRLAGKGFLVTFGVKPTGPAPEYGYILRGDPLEPAGHHVSRFVEKPSRASALGLIRRGALWNSGMFVWKAATFLEEAMRCEPSFGRWLRIANSDGIASGRAVRAFTRLQPLPVDRAVLERSGQVAVVEARFRWSDLGSWSALYELSRRDAHRNVGIGNFVALSSSDNLIYSDQGLCVLHGVKGLLVARSGNVVLVCPRHKASEMKQIVREIRIRGLGGYL